MAIQFLNNVNADNGVLYVDAVNNKVGIGTTNPQRKLSIENGGFNMFAAGGTSADAFSVVTHNYLFSDENEDSVYSYTNSEHEFSTQGMPRVTIDSTGLVGIGTTSPGSLLHVSNGELDVSGGDGYRIEGKPWANWGSDLLTLGDWDGEGYATRIMGSNSSEVMRVTGVNVGIGTTSPSSKLHVKDSAPVLKLQSSSNTSSTVSFDNSSGTQRASLFFNESTDAFGLQNLTATGNLIFTGVSGQGEFTTGTASQSGVVINYQSLALKSNYSTVFYANGIGQVGIGTTSPSDKLTVQNGNIRLNSTSSYPAQGLYAYWNSSSPNMGGISWHSNPGFIGSEWSHYKQSSPYTLARIRLIGDASSGGMFVNLNNSDVFTIKTSSGNVGIGTTAPGAKLEVNGNSRFVGSMQLYQGSTSNLYLNILQSSSNTYINTGTSGETIYFGAPASNTTNINIQGTATATNFILSSDKILKENIKNLEPKHLDIKWKSFELKSEPGINRVGVIAQELEKTNPEFVREDKDGLKSVAYIDLLINKIAELEARLEKAGL